MHLASTLLPLPLLPIALVHQPLLEHGTDIGEHLRCTEPFAHALHLDRQSRSLVSTKLLMMMATMLHTTPVVLLMPTSRVPPRVMYP